MAKTREQPITPKQLLFVSEYLKDLNATQAAIRAGYSRRTADVQGPRLLGNVRVAAAVAEAMAKREKRTEITQDRVLQELARVAFFDIRKLYNSDGTMKAPHELDDDSAAVLSSLEVIEKTEQSSLDEDEDGNPTLRAVPVSTKKAKVPDKVAALSLAMRHLGMLKDRHEHTGKDGAPLQPPVIQFVRDADPA